MNHNSAHSRGQARRQAFLTAATELFLEQGFERTSVSDIVNRSKGSRATLYQLFGNKEGLLTAMIEETTGQIWGAVGNQSDDTPMTEDDLIKVARRMVAAILNPRAIAVFRVVTTEGSHIPGIAQLFFEQGPGTVERRLAERFQRGLPQNRRTCTPEQLGHIFMGAVLGVLHPRRLLCHTLIPDDETLDNHIRLAVRVFLKGIETPD